MYSDGAVVSPAAVAAVDVAVVEAVAVVDDVSPVVAVAVVAVRADAVPVVAVLIKVFQRRWYDELKMMRMTLTRMLSLFFYVL